MIVVVGLSHRTAPIEVRELLAFSPEDVARLLSELTAESAVGEAMIVSTCNRVEVVAAGRSEPRADLEQVARAVVDRLVARAPEARRSLYVLQGSMAVRHLFRVASSLDSLVLGEPQILGQVKQAYDVAREAGTTATVLNRVVPRALRTAKRVRTETAIGAGQVSVPSVAVDLARQIFGDLGWRTAALIGSGEIGETVARLLRQAGSRLLVVGRNATRVEELAREMGGEARELATLERTLVDADVVITTTSAPGFVVEHAHVHRSRRARKGRSLFFIDLAVPRDVDPRVNELDGVFLYNVDDLSKVVAESLKSRELHAELAEQIVASEAAGYDRWAEGEQVTPVVVALRARMRATFLAEVERSLGGRLKHLSEAEREAFSAMVESALNKLLHRPTTLLRKMASDEGLRGEAEQYVTMLKDLFDLSAVPVAETGQGTTGEEPPVDTPRDEAVVTGEAHSGGTQGVR